MPKEASENKTIFVGNIPTNINAEILHSSFSPFGNIRDIQIPTDPQSRANRNFAFITFQNQIEALDAIDNMHLNQLSSGSEKILKVNLARNNFNNSNQKSNPNGGGGIGFSNPNNRAIWDNETWIKENALKEDAKDDAANKKLNPVP
ncbi:hypothetical protein MJO29_009053 [Puccinia striiformis f. sp. tritici]|uniref:RRM domain-containing protein n=2 Tax=Puccinia striiformis TaxID=27350 RepID=A0A0L0VXZ3_9BASI|nr:hypothetical protein Pst134EA_017860 [Puccinia striiformis f. sp. tritici]KAI9615925.1 hypothetical protein H4Q26_011176 [Puccinia striiformis f. sp. tritici PST-130]KNF03895.1 hypothetical protein PSTG_02982 [Puccinia striiformis f. sp. tritici PST-78]POW23422.1 hypothetical protein PSHT_00036 [Puccinia striiformis]KAH9461561.1 hypothetical protein Pst134EA_017860 [Puccinia striiformis f. sp. tritici]KAI7950379.1 hypothetical protein MJO29_009053 [Puccinia striiformis f. sp. tritici]